MDYARLASTSSVTPSLQLLRIRDPLLCGPAATETHDPGDEQTQQPQMCQGPQTRSTLACLFHQKLVLEQESPWSDPDGLDDGWCSIHV